MKKELRKTKSEQALGKLEELDELIEKFSTDPQRLYDYIRSLYGGGPLTRT